MQYQPNTGLLAGIDHMSPLELCPVDEYYLRMAQSDFLAGRKDSQATKAFFYRTPPFNGSYAILGGLTAFLRTLREYAFSNEVVKYLKDQNYREEFIRYLQEELIWVRVNVSAPREGSVILPNEPAITIQGDLISVRIAEGILLKQVNYPTLAMTKWHRVCQAAAPGGVMEFARRRAQDDIRTTLYAHLAGAAVTSNSEIRHGFDIPVTGTMGHEWVQSWGDEYTAFGKWLKYNPDKPVLLVDTIDTLKSGLPNAIRAFKKHWDRIKEAGGKPGIRNDSGDLAYITIEERKQLDAAGLEEVLIYQTNDLDEYAIEAIKSQIFTYAPRAGLTPDSVLSRCVWACGTKPGTCYDQPSLGGVMKLTSMDGRAVIKIARDNPIKTSIPAWNQSAFIWDGDEFVCCLVYMHDEDPESLTFACHPDDPSKRLDIGGLEVEYRHRLAYKTHGDILSNPTLEAVRKTVKKETDRLHWTHKRLDKPHKMKVSLSPKLFNLRQGLINSGHLIEG